jgi:hypothetical protein
MYNYATYAEYRNMKFCFNVESKLTIYCNVEQL